MAPSDSGSSHFAVTAEHPDFALAGIGNAACVQILEESRLVNRHQRPESHRHGRKLPELRHQFRVRVGQQALAAHFLAEVIELVFGETTFKIRPAIDTR